MSKMLQLDFFREDDFQVIRKEIESIRGGSEKVRKSVHAKIGKLESSHRSLEERLSLLEAFICTSKKGGNAPP